MDEIVASTALRAAYVAATDPRLADTRTPTDSSVTVAGLSDATLSFLRDPYALTVGESTVPRILVNSSVQPASGTLRLAYFIAAKSEAITQIRVPIVANAISGTVPTVIRFGIWSEDPSTGNLTLVGSTANDTTLLTSTTASPPKALQATWNKVRGQRYAWAPLVVTAGTVPSFAALTNLTLATSGETNLAPRVGAQLTGQTDLPATITAASLGNSGQLLYAALLP
jgi:hypothetical protein